MSTFRDRNEPRERSSASFEERSVWIQFVSLAVVLGAYFLVAGVMMRHGVMALPAYAVVFAVAVVLLVLVLVAGHVAAAIANRPEVRDERDRLIELQAESHSGWVLGAGVVLAIFGMVVSLPNVWVAHLLLFSLLASELLRLVLQLLYYRRGL